MKLLKKLMSKRGQISMEIGILVAAAVAVAAIAAYYYVSNVKKTSTTAGEKANKTAEAFGSAAENLANNINKSLTNMTL
jgi:uncharacterized protein (UPF0333 family)